MSPSTTTPASAPVADPILVDLPRTLDTKRLMLRHPRTGDGPMLHAAITESLPELRQFLASLPWVAAEQTLGSAETFCRNAEANVIARRDLPFFAFDKASGEFVCATGLHRPVWDTPRVEVGYWCRTSMRGKGYVSEAVQALVNFAFHHIGAARIELITDAQNTASRRVAERCGFTLEGVLHHERRAPDGTLRDTCMYACWPGALAH